MDQSRSHLIFDAGFNVKSDVDAWCEGYCLNQCSAPSHNVRVNTDTKLSATMMHSSRLRTPRLLTGGICLLAGGSTFWLRVGCLPPGQEGVGDVTSDTCWDTPPCGQNDWLTDVKPLPSRNFVAGGNYLSGIITTHQRSCGRLMFSVICVCLFTVRGVSHVTIMRH